MIKKRFFLLFCIVLVFVAISVTADPLQLSATLVSQSPSPVEPGEIVTVKIQVENDGAATNQDVIVRLAPEHPLTLYRGSLEKNLGKLPAAVTGGDAREATFYLRVAEDAVEQNVPLNVYLDVGEGSLAYINDEFTIDVETRDAVLSITKVKFTPEQVPPGETATMEVTVKNFGDSLLRDLRFKLDLDDVALPLAPYQSSSEQRLSLLEGNYQDTIAFTLIADPAATTGLYKVPLQISYTDERGNPQSVTELLAVKVGETPKLRVYVRKSTVQKAGEQGIVTIGLANAGTTDIKFLEMTVQPSESYDLVSPSNYFYIGDVDSDDTESEDIHLFIDSDAEELSLPLEISYYDANNRQFTQQVTIPLALFSGGELKRYGLVESSNGWIFFVILLLAGGGFWWWRRRKKAKAK